jgi:peptide-methionine (S)-S-oxide reductase
VLFSRHKTKMVAPAEALPGREQPAFAVPERHAVLGTSLEPPFPEGMSVAVFGLGCFWGAERRFWQIDGVYTTAAGYAGGFTPNPTYKEVCSGRTGHTEAVLVVFDPEKVSYRELLAAFWEAHDPTQGMRHSRVAVTARSPRRSRLLARSTTPRGTTSNTSTKSPTGTAAWAGPA